MRCFAGLIPPSEWNSNLAWSDFIQYSSFVSQSPFLFHDTLRSNLVYGAADASPSDGEITDALKKVGLDIFLGTLPSGLDTLFNPVAHNLSGGQIQRLVVARAMLRGRPILLLDEAMAAIDGATEQSLTNALIDIVHLASTVLLSVTHRTTWLHLFDEVWFLENGRIVMKGPHDSLLKDRKYRDFIASGHAQAAP
jgi:ATP-binding cassette subfamily B protein